MLTSKKRLAVLIIGIIIFIGPFVINQTLILLNSPLNPTNVNLYQYTTEIEYEFQEGDIDADTESLTLDIEVGDDPEDDYTQVEAELDKSKANYEMEYKSGKYVEGGDVKDKYTFFWIPVKNPMLTAGEFAEEEEYEIIDPLGLLGNSSKTYTLVVGEKKVFWDVPAGMDGAQFSFIINIYDENDSKVADGLMDSTCGFLEVLDAKDRGFLEIKDPGEYPVSRNRYNMLWWGLAFAIAAPFVCFLILKKKEVDIEEIKEFVLLVGIAGSVVIIDIIIDVWFYARIGRSGMLYMHLGCFAVYALVCAYLKYGIKWALPAFLEVAFVFAMTSFVGDPYVPHITAFMGLYASYLAILYRSGIDKKRYDDKLDILV